MGELIRHEQCQATITVGSVHQCVVRGQHTEHEVTGPGNIRVKWTGDIREITGTGINIESKEGGTVTQMGRQS